MEQQTQQQATRYVINLCALPTPITIPQPRASRLTRFSFFLNHSWEEGRRQYRLFMGYFASVAEAEKWLNTLRRVYPLAFISKAPDVQPELMSSTQALRILEIGKVDSVSSDAARASEPKSRMAETVPARESASKSTTAVRESSRGGVTLEDTLQELRTSEFDMQVDDDPNATGVRHLQIEVQRDKVTRMPQQRIGSRSRK